MGSKPEEVPLPQEVFYDGNKTKSPVRDEVLDQAELPHRELSHVVQDKTVPRMARKLCADKASAVRLVSLGPHRIAPPFPGPELTDQFGAHLSRRAGEIGEHKSPSIS
jgi:hypothetical protein